MKPSSGNLASVRSPYYVRPIEVNCPTARFMAFPYAGSGAVVYHQWASYLPSGIELVSMQYPGRGRLINKHPHTSIDALAAETYETILTLSDKPFYLFGHSMGALVAFESVRMLRRSGKSLPKALIVSACQSPQSAPFLDGKLHTLPDEQLLAGLMNYGGMPEEILQSPDMMAYVMPLLRADMMALETWNCKPEPPLDIPILVLSGNNDKTVDPEQLLRWSDFTNKACRFYVMPGNHFYFQQQLPAIMEKIQSVIEETMVG